MEDNVNMQPMLTLNAAVRPVIGKEADWSLVSPSQIGSLPDPDGLEQPVEGQSNLASIVPAHPPDAAASPDLRDEITDFPTWPKSVCQKRVPSSAASPFGAKSATRAYLQSPLPGSFALPKTPKRKGQLSADHTYMPHGFEVCGFVG